MPGAHTHINSVSHKFTAVLAPGSQTSTDPKHSPQLTPETPPYAPLPGGAAVLPVVP